jgi:hypothetical protein
MNLSPDFYNTSLLYVPRPGSHAEAVIAKGSAIVGAFEDRQYDSNRTLVYYEGNLYGAVNLNTFEERCDCAHGRMAQRYPTIAMASIENEDLVLVGYWHPRERIATIDNLPAWTVWCERS